MFYPALIKLQSLPLLAALSGCLSCTEILWDFKANLDVQDEVGWTHFLTGLCNVVLDKLFLSVWGGLLDTFTQFLNVFASGWVYPFDFSSPDEQSGTVCLSPGSRRQRKHTRQWRKVMWRVFFLFLRTAAMYAVCLCGCDRWNSREGQPAPRQNPAVFAKLVETKK